MTEIQTKSQSSAEIKRNAVLIGGALGALLGAGLAFMMARQIEDSDSEFEASPGSILAIALGILGLMRQFSELARADK